MKNKHILHKKIDQLNDQAWELRVSNSSHSFALSKEASDLAEGCDYLKGTAEALRTLGFCYIRFSKHTEAIPLLLKSLQLFEQLNDLRGQSSIYGYLGIVKRSTGDYAA